MHFRRSLLVAAGLFLLALKAGAGTTLEDDEKAETWAQMHRAWEAIMAYQRDHGQVPDHLSDLIPRYVPDADALISPTEKRTGRHGDFDHKDPKVRNSFCYEFSAKLYRSKTATKRESKEAQMQEFGAVVPILRCFLYERVLNIAYSGDAYESAVTWENSREARALMARIGEGPGFADTEFTAMTVVDAESGAPIAGAEVRLTNRWYRSFWYPERTLRTGVDGTVRIPLGPPQPPSRKVTVSVSKAGYYAPPETWEEGKLPEESVFGLERGDEVGGVVKLRDGSRLVGARVEVSFLAPGADGKIYRMPLTTEVSGAGGRWRCDRLPKKHEGLWLRVSHSTAWSGWFQSHEQPGPGKMTVTALKAGTVNILLAPAAVLHGTVTSAEGAPVEGAEIFAVAKTQPGAENRAMSEPAPVKTDAQGRYSFPWCEAGKLALLVFPPAGAPTRFEIEPAPGLGATDLRLAPGRTIPGRIVGEDGRPASGARISLAEWSGDAVSIRKPVATTDAAGNFAWSSAPGEPVKLRLSCDGFFDRCATIVADSTGPLRVRMFRRGGQ